MRIVVVPVILLLSLAGAWGAMVAAHGLSYGDQAALKAGKSPPSDVSLRVEALMASQEIANASITGALLGGVLSGGSLLLGREHIRSVPWGIWRTALALIRGSVTGTVLIGLACLVFRRQPMGSQDLILATGVHGVLWAGLGTTVFDLRSSRRGGATHVPLPVLAGLVWGVLFPTLVVVFAPDVYVEQLFSTRPLIGLWAGGGCAILLSSDRWEARRPPGLSSTGGKGENPCAG